MTTSIMQTSYAWFIQNFMKKENANYLFLVYLELGEEKEEDNKQEMKNTFKLEYFELI